MTDDRRAQIDRAIADFEARGEAWTNKKVHAAVGGNYEQLSQYLKERRAGMSGESSDAAEEEAAVAVLEAPEGTAAEERTEEAQYHAEIAQLEAAIRRAESAHEQAIEALLEHASRYAATKVIDEFDGFQRRHATPTSDRGELHWQATPSRDQAHLERLIGERYQGFEAVERARLALSRRQQVWQQARAREAFLATPQGQVLKRELEEIMEAYDVAKAANQSYMVVVLGRKLDNVNHRIAMAMHGL